MGNQTSETVVFYIIFNPKYLQLINVLELPFGKKV